MNRQAFWIVPALALALAAPAAAKNNGKGKGGGKGHKGSVATIHEEDRGEHGGRYRGDRDVREERGDNMRFRGIDRNGDGVITRGEWPGNDTSFEQHDRNRDGVLTGAEVRAGAARDDARLGTFGRLDRNDDGVLDGREWPYGSSRFARLDRNGNRVIETWEYRLR